MSFFWGISHPEDQLKISHLYIQVSVSNPFQMHGVLRSPSRRHDNELFKSRYFNNLLNVHSMLGRCRSFSSEGHCVEKENWPNTLYHLICDDSVKIIRAFYGSDFI